MNSILADVSKFISPPLLIIEISDKFHFNCQSVLYKLVFGQKRPSFILRPPERAEEQGFCSARCPYFESLRIIFATNTWSYRVELKRCLIEHLKSYRLIYKVIQIVCKLRYYPWLKRQHLITWNEIFKHKISYNFKKRKNLQTFEGSRAVGPVGGGRVALGLGWCVISSGRCRRSVTASWPSGSTRWTEREPRWTERDFDGIACRRPPVHQATKTLVPLSLDIFPKKKTTQFSLISLWIDWNDSVIDEISKN